MFNVSRAACFVFDGEVLVTFPDQAFDVSVYPGGLSFFFALLVGINMSIPVSMWCLSACHVVSTSPRPGIFSSWLKF